MKLNEKITITEERMNSDERSYERMIMCFLVGSYKAAPGYRMEVMSSRETGYETFAVEVSVYMPRKKAAYATFYIELNSMNIQLAGTQDEPKMIYYRGSFEECKGNEYKAYCTAADFMGRMEQPAPETAAPNAPQEAANDETEADTDGEAEATQKVMETKEGAEMKKFEVGKSYKASNRTNYGHVITIVKLTEKTATYFVKGDESEGYGAGHTFRAKIWRDGKRGNTEYINGGLHVLDDFRAEDEIAVEQPAPETAAPDAPQEAANDEPEADTMEQSATDNGPEAEAGQPAPQEDAADSANYDFLTERYTVFEWLDMSYGVDRETGTPNKKLHPNGIFSEEWETDSLKEARERLKEEWDSSLESGGYAIFDRDARQYIQIRGDAKARLAFKRENERLARQTAPVNSPDAPAIKAAAADCYCPTCARKDCPVRDKLQRLTLGDCVRFGGYVQSGEPWDLAEVKRRHGETD